MSSSQVQSNTKVCSKNISGTKTVPQGHRLILFLFCTHHVNDKNKYNWIKTTQVENDFSMFKGGFKYLDSVCMMIKGLMFKHFIVHTLTAACFQGDQWIIYDEDANDSILKSNICVHPTFEIYRDTDNTGSPPKLQAFIVFNITQNLCTWFRRTFSENPL